MMREYDFRVAGFLFKLHLPEEQDIDRLLPSFRPFRCVTDIQGRAIFNFVAVSSSLSEKELSVYWKRRKVIWDISVCLRWRRDTGLNCVILPVVRYMFCMQNLFYSCHGKYPLG